jgi:hypothetical protein
VPAACGREQSAPDEPPVWRDTRCSRHCPMGRAESRRRHPARPPGHPQAAPGTSCGAGGVACADERSSRQRRGRSRSPFVSGSRAPLARRHRERR